MVALAAREKLQVQADEEQKLLDIMGMSRDQKLDVAKKLKEERRKMLRELGIEEEEPRPPPPPPPPPMSMGPRAGPPAASVAPPRPTRRPAPWLTNVSRDVADTGRLTFYLRPGATSCHCFQMAKVRPSMNRLPHDGRPHRYWARLAAPWGAGLA